ncbi:MAG: major capsid protein [Synergistaceae bacterium]|nr:major capsid protein [Synergistaceae bacterium]
MSTFDTSEILNLFTPYAMTEAISLLKTTEPFILTRRLGQNVTVMLDEACIFEVEEGSYNLAPVGFPNDPPSSINISRKRTRHSVVPPQIFLKDRIPVSEINRLRTVSQNPINMTRQDKQSVYDQLVAVKQTGLRRLIERRIEWFFAQALNGKIDYKNDEGRSFTFDYKLPKAVETGDAWDKAGTPGNPIHQLRMLAKSFKAINNQLAPDLIIMGGKAGDAFMNNPFVEEWLRSPGIQLFENRTELAKGEAVPIGVLQGAELFEYSATYEDNKGKATPYIEDGYVYLTNSTLWRLFYGAISDFDAGNPPIVARDIFSKMKTSQDGKTMDIFIESHPLPVIVSNLGVVKAKVCE